AAPDPLSPQGDDNYGLAADLAQQLGVPLHSVILMPESLADLAAADFTRRSVHMLEYENQILCHARYVGVNVMLSGWGGDDVATIRHWGGWFDLLHQHRWIEAWREVRLGAQPARNAFLAVGSWIYYGRRRRTPAKRLRPQWQIEGYIPM